MAEKAMEESYHHQLEDPWIRESVFTKKLLVDEGPNGKSRFHLIDPWHMLHLGMGKAWVASGVMLLQKLLPESSIDKRVSIIAAEYKRYCKRMKIDPIIRKIDLSNFGGGGSNEANGSWNKAAITSNFLRFLEDYCEKNIDTSTASEKLRIFVSPHICFDCFSCMGFSFKVLDCVASIIFLASVFKGGKLQEPMVAVYFANGLLIKVLGTKKINEFMRGILSHDVLIPKEAGLQISDALHLFCRSYVYEAAAAQKDFLPYFPLLPKLHFLHEVCFRMRRECQHASHCFNPAAASCSMDEDFIGRAAQITRCVSPMLIPQRTLERYLCHIQLAWSRE